MSFISEFKEFAIKGNVVDLAVGIIIGGAFTKIVTSFVGDIIMPIVGSFLGGINFNKLEKVIGSKILEDGTIQTVTIKYGAFIQTIFDFIIIAFVIFMMIKGINRLRKVKDVVEGPNAQEKLLTEIRDLLKK